MKSIDIQVIIDASFDALGSTECDIFTGEWVSDPTGPWYTNSTCNSIQQHQNCMMNGRPDTDYIYWRWSPFECKLPAFDPKMFLHFMRNKSMAFIGDSISRNQVQSLFCILSQVQVSCPYSFVC